MRIAFMGTPEFAVPTLDSLAGAGHDVVAVYSQPPRPAGRGKALRPSPVQQRAESLGIEVRTPLSLKDPEAQAGFAALDLDAAIVAAYGLILPRPILEAPRRGCLNVHASILPRWRGAAPIQRAILAGDETTGVTIMQMEQGLDTGPYYAGEVVEIGEKTAGELESELARVGARLLVHVLGDLGRAEPVPQDDPEATYAPKIRKEEARLDCNKPAAQVLRQVRAFNPSPGAFFECRGERIKVHRAVADGRAGPPGHVLTESLAIACGAGSIQPTLVQRAGRAPMTVEELLRGFPIPPGTVLE